MVISSLWLVRFYVTGTMRGSHCGRRLAVLRKMIAGFS